jgi:hypothetical protein
MTRLSITAFASILALLGLAAPAHAQQQLRLPTELWEEYPLDPTVGEERQEQTATGEAPTATEPIPATEGTSTTTPAANRQAARPVAEKEEDGSIVLPLAAGLGGLALFVASGVVFVAQRRRRSVDVEAGPAPWPSAHAQRSLRQRLRSESGLLVPFAEGAPPRATKVSAGKNPPPRKDLPGMAPLPEKKRQVRSGLPPGKTVPSNRELSKPPSKGVADPASKNRRRPTTTQEPEPPRELVSEPSPAPPPAARPLRAAAKARGRAEECVVEWWRGYAKSDFYAVSAGPDGRPYVAARSRPFSWYRGEPPPPTGVAAKAHADLLAGLAADGWEETGGGRAWYRTRLRRALKPTLRDLTNDAH